MTCRKIKLKQDLKKKNARQRGALRIEIRRWTSTQSGDRLYYLLTLKIITGRLARARCACQSGRRLGKLLPSFGEKKIQIGAHK